MLKSIILLTLTLHLFSSFAFSMPKLSDYPVDPSSLKEQECKALDYSSYHYASRAKSNIKKSNPDLTHPNFAGQYLLIKNEMLFETLWFVVDCKTGDFFRQKLNASDVKFDRNSKLLILLSDKSKKNPEPDQYRVWSENQWLKIEATEAKPSASDTTTSDDSTASALKTSSTTLKTYEPIFAKYPAQIPPGIECRSPVFSTLRRVERYKTSILEANSIPKQPTFAGTYYLIQNNFLIGSEHLVVNCLTGMIYDAAIKGTPNYRADSTLLVVTEEDEFPEMMAWGNQQWRHLHNPLQNQKKIIKNTIYGKDAERLITLLSLPKKPQYRIRVDRVACTVDASACTLTEASSENQILTTQPELRIELRDWLKKWGYSETKSLSINEASCNHEERKTAQCSIRSGVEE